MEGIIQSILKNTVKIKAKEQKAHDEGHVLEQIRELRTQMGVIRCCFDLETNYDMIDFYIMQLDALEKRYSFLIKKAKQIGLVAF